MIRRIPLFALLLFPGLALVSTRAQAAKPERIIALNPLIAEWTAEIIGSEYSSKRMVGVSEYSSWPAELKKIQSIGPYPKPDVERIASLRPDLVLASEEYNRPETLEPLSRLKLRVKVLPREKFQTFGEWITELGAVLEEPARATKLRGEWEQGLRSLRAGGKRSESFFLEIQHEPLITIGGSSFLSDALEAAGFRNVFRDVGSGYPKVSMESVVRSNPDWIFVLGHEQGAEEIARSRKDWARFNAIPAVRKGRIVILPGDDYARCSLRLLNALKQLKLRHE